MGNGTVQPEHPKIDAIENFEKPKTKKAVRTFLGMTGYYRKFIPDYSTVACSLKKKSIRNTIFVATPFIIALIKFDARKHSCSKALSLCCIYTLVQCILVYIHAPHSNALFKHMQIDGQIGDRASRIKKKV